VTATMPRCSVVVCTRKRVALAARCLAALAALDHPSYEVIVVDNSVGDAATAELANRWCARYVLESRIGLSRARNAGARAARGVIVAFIDDDAVADPAWLRHHADALEDGTLGATTGRTVWLNPDAVTARAYDAVGADDLGTTPFRVDRGTEDWFERVNFGGVGVGSNFALRRRLFDSGWGFREDLGLGHRILGEEHYAFFELLRSGYAIEYVPDAVVRHEPRASLEAVELRKRRTLRAGSAYMVMLLVEERGYRWPTLKYAVSALRGRRRSWRGVQVTAPFASRRDRLLAGLAGPMIYASNRLHAGRRGRRTAPANVGFVSSES
jgi:cellulose synthase/poly-beta-1,6-N-acetylglucosamine synthase-like glycosyltransferase